MDEQSKSLDIVSLITIFSVLAIVIFVGILLR
jgi:hypothetical protein